MRNRQEPLDDPEPAAERLVEPRLERHRIGAGSEGGRLTGRVGDYEIGLINIETSDKPTSRSLPTAFTIGRIKRDILRKSSVGAMATHRSQAPGRTSPSDTLGVDGIFGFGGNLTLVGGVKLESNGGFSFSDLRLIGPNANARIPIGRSCITTRGMTSPGTRGSSPKPKVLMRLTGLAASWCKNAAGVKPSGGE